MILTTNYLIFESISHPTYNSDGLIKCLPRPGTTSQSILKSTPLNFVPFIKYCGTQTVSSPWTASSGCGPTRRCRVFCLHRDYFIVTRNFTAVYRDLVPFRSCTVTLSSLPSTGPDSYRDGKKLVTATPRRNVAGSRHLIKPPGR